MNSGKIEIIEDVDADGNDISVENTFDSNGNLTKEEWSLNGYLHREDGPAITIYRPDGSKEREEWWWEGEKHREDGPAVIFYRPDETVELEEYWREGEVSNYHRGHLMDAARQFFRPDGSVECEEYIENGYYDNDGLATIVCYYESGKVKSEYCQYAQVSEKNELRDDVDEVSRLHCEVGPAVIEYRPDGSTEREEWWWDDQQHRLDGPAVIYYNEDGSVKSEEFYFYSEPLSKDEFEAQRNAYLLEKALRDLGVS